MCCFFFYPGKTTLILKFLANEAASFKNPNFTRRYWCIPAGGAAPAEVLSRGDFEILTGWPSGIDLEHGSLCVVDDLQSEISQEALNCFIVFQHHKSLTLISTNHNLFPTNKFQRTITLSTKYIVVLNSPRDTQSFLRFAVQVEPLRAPALYRAFLDACVSSRFGFLLCDLTTGIHPALKYRTFPVTGVPADGTSIYASDDDINSLIRCDDRYVRFSEEEFSHISTHHDIETRQAEGVDRSTDEGRD